MGTRQQLAAALIVALGPKVKVIDSPRDFDEIPATFDFAIQLVRQKVGRAPTRAPGDYLEDFEIWVIEPKLDPAKSEDNLDAALDRTLVALDSMDFIDFDEAVRDTHPTDRHAYRIPSKLISSKEDTP